MKKAKHTVKRLFLALCVLFVAGLLIPHGKHMPVKGATAADYHPESFSYYPWGKSVTHKGVDIFAQEGTDVQSTTPGIVVFSGNIAVGGEVVSVVGPKWRLHYYAHLNYRSVALFSLAQTGKKIGAVGRTGNAAGKPPHLHYSIFSLVPLPWRIDNAPQGWRKMFYLDPIDYLSD